jgi:hypothetical protein
MRIEAKPVQVIEAPAVDNNELWAIIGAAAALCAAIGAAVSD